MDWKMWSLKKSVWVFHVNTGACNNCDIEIVNCLTGVTAQAAPRLREVYRQTSKPCVVFAIGACACEKGIFTTGYHMVGPVDKIIKEIDPNAIIAYVPGCPPKPEAIISGVVKALSVL